MPTAIHKPRPGNERRAANRRAATAARRAPHPFVPSTFRDRFGNVPSHARENARRLLQASRRGEA